MIPKSMNSFRMWSKRLFTNIFHHGTVSVYSNKNQNKNVLLSYITHPFLVENDDPSFYTHTNAWECRQIAASWLEQGYNVDVIDWDNSKFIPKKKYAVFIDIHSNMERLLPYLDQKCFKILHITGAHWKFQNAAEMKRLVELEKRRGFRLVPRRQVAPSFAIEHADCATILGNSFTQETFAYAGKPLYSIPLSTTVQYPFRKKQYERCRNNFLWIGSSGMVHKGLDLVLDAFNEMPEYNLTICGPVHQEPDFEESYYKELYQSKNIRTLGFIDTHDAQFFDIIKKTVAVVYPSCSEGGGGSVITCMHAGLIPIVSREASVDIGNFGICLDSSSLDDIKTSIITIAQKSEVELEKMSKEAWYYARTHHSRKRFAEQYNKFVKNIITNEE